MEHFFSKKRKHVLLYVCCTRTLYKLQAVQFPFWVVISVRIQSFVSTMSCWVEPQDGCRVHSSNLGLWHSIAIASRTVQVAMVTNIYKLFKGTVYCRYRKLLDIPIRFNEAKVAKLGEEISHVLIIPKNCVCISKNSFKIVNFVTDYL